jgi:hypothetical protein
MNLPVRLRLPAWLHDLVGKHLIKAKKQKAVKAQKRRYVTHGCDIRCPGCNRWASDIESLEGMGHLSRPSFGSHILCHACGTKSYWNYEAAPVPLRCHPNGVPIISVRKTSTGETVPEPDSSSAWYDKKTGQRKKYRVCIRRGLAEVRPEADQIDGKIYSFRDGWLIRDDETTIYYGEFAMLPDDDDYPSDAPSWIASGDLKLQ